VLIRERQEEDLAASTQLAHLVQDLDGYPPYLPGEQLSQFIQSSDAIAVWVADADGDLVGHVALHSRSSQAVMGRASGTVENPTERFGVVARLFVSPAARRTGVGRTLLQTAAAHAVGLGLRPMLDVATQFQPAITLYESCGWRRAVMVTVALPDGNSIDEFVFFAPYSPASS
jgi:GNAT superfamily N-acetyltransferase